MRAVLACAIPGLLIVVLIVASQLIWSFNPYREATEQVHYLLKLSQTWKRDWITLTWRISALKTAWVQTWH